MKGEKERTQDYFIGMICWGDPQRYQSSLHHWALQSSAITANDLSPWPFPLLYFQKVESSKQAHTVSHG